jgi:thiol-disulfide isomerase/thioredoxin
MTIKVVEFSELESDITKTSGAPWDLLAEVVGKAYVVAITRDGCSACEKQKPKLDELAKRIAAKHGEKAVFTRIHVKLASDSQDESLRSKEILGHYFYPTNLILLRTGDRGAFEFYRNVSPDMKELEGNIEHALEVAAMMEKQTS